MSSLHARITAAERLAGKRGGVSVAAVRRALSASYESNTVPRTEALQKIVTRIRRFIIAADLATGARTAEELFQGLPFTPTAEEADVVKAALQKNSEEAEA